MDERIQRLAPPQTVLGDLQRGRGEGFLALGEMARNEAADLLWECIVHDPRWDLQVESRSSFYADAAIALDFDVDRLRPVACPEPHDDVDQCLIVDVLGELAARRVRGAEPVLLDHVRSGQKYDDAELQVAAQLVFERHAQVSDRPAIEQRLEEAWDSRDFYGLCGWIDALALIPDQRTFDLVEPVFEAADYSYARGRAARALTAADPQRFVSTFARSALWDCEDDVQRFAAQMLEGLLLDPLAMSRVAEIASGRASRRVRS